MNQIKRDPEREPVVAVCGSEARVYGPVPDLSKAPRDPRPLLQVKQFSHRGHAIQFAEDFENPTPRGKA